MDPDFEPDVTLLTDALTILKSIRHFWTSIEKDLGSFEEFGDVDIDEVTPRLLAVLQMCIDAYVARLPPIGVALPSEYRRSGEPPSACVHAWERDEFRR